jgi:hypothetical protein
MTPAWVAACVASGLRRGFGARPPFPVLVEVAAIVRLCPHSSQYPSAA